MYFSLSKIIWGVVEPSHIILWCSLLAVALLLLNRRRAGLVFVILTAVLLVGLGVVPAYVWLARPLEYRFADLKPPARADGILVLGGNPQGDQRLPVAYMVSRRYPNAKLVFGGGSGELIDNRPNEAAAIAGQILYDLGLAPSRLILEGHSRNTRENIQFAKALIKPRPGETWILVTSAYHMPRAMEIADGLHWKMFPWPSEHISNRHEIRSWFSVANNLDKFDVIVHERIGLLFQDLSSK